MHTISESVQAAKHISVYKPKNIRVECCLKILLKHAQAHKIAL